MFNEFSLSKILQYFQLKHKLSEYMEIFLQKNK